MRAPVWRIVWLEICLYAQNENDWHTKTPWQAGSSKQFNSSQNLFVFFCSLITGHSLISRAIKEDRPQINLKRPKTGQRQHLATRLKAKSGDMTIYSSWEAEDGCSRVSHWTADRTRSMCSWIQLTAHSHARLVRALPNHYHYLSCSPTGDGDTQEQTGRGRK